MGTVVVYEAEIPWARQAQTVLREAGIQSELLNVSPTVMREKAAFTTIIKVAVSSNDVTAAREVLQRWATESESAAAPLSRSLGRSLLVVVGPPVVAGIAVSAFHVQAPDWLWWVGVGWVVASIAVIARRQQSVIEGQR